MTRTFAASRHATKAHDLVSGLQQRFVTGLEQLSDTQGHQQGFKRVEWLRDEGIHGGGLRFETADGHLFGRGSVNVSQVHYDDNPDKKLGSASAISTIIHPVHPLAPSVHIHISWTEMKSGQGYWRLMADLNPSNENTSHTTKFLTDLKAVAPELYDEAIKQGDCYFNIPVLNRHRGVAHFYLEHYNTTDIEADYQLAISVGEAAIDSYLDILADALTQDSEPTQDQQTAQLAYHTLYFFQVLTLDRGTTTGLLVHDQNDVGIMGSLPAYVDVELLKSWVARMPEPQDNLLGSLIAVLPTTSPALVDASVKQQLAKVVRSHYQTHPEAIAMQASGDVIPATVKNHD